MLYVLAYPKLSATDAVAIEAFRHKHEPARANMVKAHVTLVFGVTSISPGALTLLASGFARAQAPFDFAIERLEVEAHEQGDHNLFLKIGRGSDTFTALYRAFYAGELASERGDIEFSPHITIATNSDLRTIMLAAPEAKPLVAISGRIEALDVASLQGQVLTSIATLPLSG